MNEKEASAPRTPARKANKAGVAMGLAVVIVLAGMLGYREFIGRVWPLKKTVATAAVSENVAVKLASGVPNGLLVEPAVGERMGLRMAAAELATVPDTLRLAGSLTLDATRMQQVRSRFEGEIIELGKTADGTRPLRFGDTVSNGQLLAVVSSRELGEKKSELIDALSQLHLDQKVFDQLSGIAKSGAIPGRELQTVEHSVETDRVAAARVERTLQTWNVAAEEIEAVKQEAQRLIQGEQVGAAELTQRWARVEVRSAIDGTILEQNVAVGDLVGPTDDIFKVADLSRLRVLAYAFEEDLPRLDSLPVDQRKWTISIPAAPDIPTTVGEIELIGKIIDPNQHTALVMGWVSNPTGHLRSGQFVSALIAFPLSANEVMLPAGAVVEKGGESLVFVAQTDGRVLARRSVAVSRQAGDQVCVLIDPPKSNQPPVIEGLKPNETVVISGAVELQQVLMDLNANQKAKHSQERP